MAVTAVRLHERIERPAVPGVVAGLRRYAPALGAYALSQLLVTVVALLLAATQHQTVGAELSRWDGQWYLSLASHGYPSRIPDMASTLGFLPGYSILIRALGAAWIPPLPAALVIARLGGLVSALFVQELTTTWWGHDVGRRAAVLYAVFPGTVVFSMAYSDGLFLALVTGCLLALERRRWLTAGLSAAAATATGADGAVLVLACMAGAAIHLVRTRAWENHGELRCLAAPLLAPVGLGAFCIYLWVRVGSPLAFEQAQRRYWGNHISVSAAFQHYLLYLQLGGRELNALVGLAGIPFIIGTRYLLLRRNTRPPAPALVWGFGVTALSLLSAGLSANPRMLLISFPSGVVLARVTRGAGFAVLVAASATALAFISWWTLGGHILP